MQGLRSVRGWARAVSTTACWIADPTRRCCLQQQSQGCTAPSSSKPPCPRSACTQANKGTHVMHCMKLAWAASHHTTARHVHARNGTPTSQRHHITARHAHALGNLRGVWPNLLCEAGNRVFLFLQVDNMDFVLTGFTDEHKSKTTTYTHTAPRRDDTRTQQGMRRMCGRTWIQARKGAWTGS